MAEYADRYDVGSLESTQRRFTDLELMRRLIFDYMLRHKMLFTLEILLIFSKMITVLTGPTSTRSRSTSSSTTRPQGTAFGLLTS